ncbi:hypothetical protein D3C72_1092930 [compost metagenome]
MDLSSICSSTAGNWIPIGDVASNPSLSFEGTFDGRGHKINNLYINDNSLSNRALFGQIKNANILNLTLSGTVTGAKDKISGIVAYAENSNLENCNNYVSVNNTSASNYVTSGIAGYVKDTNVKNCKNYGNVSTLYQQAGGIVATTEQSDNTKIIDSCENYGNITSTNIAGGIVGYISKNGIIQNSNNFNCTIKTTTNYAAGGIAGYVGSVANATIKDCKNSSYCESKAGGAGGMLGGSRRNCYNNWLC